MIGRESRFNPGLQAPAPQQSGSLISPQSLGMLMNAYKAYQDQQTGTSPGATGTGYAPMGQGGQQGVNGAGYGVGQPLVAGGQSGQPEAPMVGQPPAMQNQALLQAMQRRGGY